MSERRVVITGLGVVTPIGTDVPTFWQNLINGVCGIDRIQAFDPTGFDTQIAAEIREFDPTPAFPSSKDLRRTDRYIKFAVMAAHEALKDSGLELDKEDTTRIGVYIGSGIGGIWTIEEQHKILLDKGPKRLSPFMIPMLIINMASGIFAIYYGLKGPNIATCTACATAAHAIGEAWRVIKMGAADLMFAGGSEAAITPLGIGGFCAMKAMSTRNDDPKHASRPFDAERDGFVMGEGAGVVVLEELEHAKRRGAKIYAELVGYGATADAYHLTAPEPNGDGAARCMRMALATGKLSPTEVDYINAHGTSTPYNDAIETKAIKQVFGDHAYKLPISSIKGATGHMLGAAGAVELVASAKAIETGIIPPTLNYEYPDPECDLDYVPNQAREKKLRVVLSNSFGFGGHNATLALRKI